MSTHRQCAAKSSLLDAEVRARMQESHDRAKHVLEASKLALGAQRAHPLTKASTAANRLDISNLFGHQSYTLPSSSEEPVRRSLSPRPSFDPGRDDMQSTRKHIGTEDDIKSHLTTEHTARTATRTTRPSEMFNRSGARAVAANLDNSHNLTVNDILAGSRSERVRRMSQAPAASSYKRIGGKSPQKRAIERFEQDENNFIAEIPSGFAPKSPPTCLTPLSEKNSDNNRQSQVVPSAKIPIQLEDFGGEGYLMRNDLSFNKICNKESNRADSICLPLESERDNTIVDSFLNEQNHLLADAFSKLNHTNMSTTLVSAGNLSRVSKSPVKSPQNKERLLGGNLDGCLDCIGKCHCDRRSKIDDLFMRQRLDDDDLECMLMDDKDNFETGGVSIECTVPKVSKREACGHSSYLDRVMKSLDRKDMKDFKQEKDKNACYANVGAKEEKNRSNDNCRNLEVVPARKARSMIGCCPGMNNEDEDRGGMTACCKNYNNNNNDEVMSVCSQGFGSEKGSHVRRANSQMSTVSEFNFINGYLPLKSTHNELSWPSVKLRKSAKKSLQIKNTSTKRLIIRVILDGPGFNLENPEANGRGTITLQPREVRTIMLIFNPTVLGPAVGNLIFQPPIEYCAAGGGCATMSTIDSPVTKRVIRLYGYGGHVSYSFERLQQGPVGTKFMPLGSLCNLNKVFEEVFVIRNKGNLTGFAAVMLENKTVGKAMFDHAIHICPDKVLIPPNSSAKIKVSFQPTGNDMREMMKIHRNSEVITIGNILVVTGDEATRCRVKRLITASKELSEKYSTKQLMNIWSDYGSRDCDEYDFHELRETGMAVADLISSFTSKEVALTLNNSASDISLIDASGWISEVEDSDALFHTICQPGETSDCCIAPPDHDKNMLPHAMTKRRTDITEDPRNPDVWNVTPTQLNFNVNQVLPEVLTIHSKTSKNRMFEIDSNVANYFCVSPQEGVITPSCDTTNISVRMMNYNIPACPMFVYVYIDNDRICVPVSVEMGPPEGKASCPVITKDKVSNLA